MTDSTSTPSGAFAAQILQEARQKALGIQRYRAKSDKAQRKQPSTHGSGKELLNAVMPRLTQAIKDACKKPRYTRGDRKKTGKVPGNQGPGKRATVTPLLRLVKPEAAALITARTVFDAVANNSKRGATSIAMMVGARVEDEVKFLAFKKADPIGYRSAMRIINYSSDYRYKHKVLTQTNNQNTATSWVPWKPIQRTHVGAKLIDLMAASTGTVEFIKVGRTYVITLTDATLDAILAREVVLEDLAPWFLPMLEPPKPWTTLYDGGYQAFEMPLVKDRWRGAALEAYERADMPVVYEAVNQLQNTAWRVNQDVYTVFSELWKTARELPGVPSRERIPIPLRPPELPPRGTKLDEVQTETLKGFKRAKSESYREELARRSNLHAAAKILEVAAMHLEGSPELYFPYQLDWRGRAYAVPLFLSPQGRDLSRGLLEFAEGKPLDTEEAVEWWFTQGANCFGVDKVSFEERHNWVGENVDKILKVAEDPISNTWWMEADGGKTAWQFLAWCLEFQDWEDDPDSFKSHLPIAMDGSCNGLQHFSAMLRDPVGGEAVNLLPTKKPQDIYQRVVNRVRGMLMSDADSITWSQMAGGPIDPETGRHYNGLARQWLDSGFLNRSIVKQQVMTYPYGATKVGMKQQLLNRLDELKKERKLKHLPFENIWEATLYLTAEILPAIESVVKASPAAMEWLQGVARACNKKGFPVRWTTPHGFPVSQSYKSQKTTRVKTQLMGSANLRLELGTDVLDRRKQVAGVSPNFVHSLDACHMMQTMVAMGEGVSYAMVHDSFGCHAADAPRLARTLRETFVALYENHDVLAELKAEVEKYLGVGKLPELPKVGTLDIQEVLRAKFFFA